MRGLVDTNIIIYLSKHLLEVQTLFEKYETLFISRITHMEVLGFNFEDSEEEALVNKLIGHFQLLEINSMVGEMTIIARKTKKIKLPDAIIYATAKVYNCDLITANEKDFWGLKEGVKVFNPMI